MMENILANKGTILFVGEKIFWQCDFTRNFTPNIHRILEQGVDLKYSISSTPSAVGKSLSISSFLFKKMAEMTTEGSL